MERMRIVSVNVGTAGPVAFGSREFVTGIDKRPAAGAVRVTPLGLAADAVVDSEHHGGADQAIYAYGAEDYAWWSRELGRDLRPGTFGDNLTIAEFPPDLNAGDRLLVGDVILEATAPRIPCSTLAVQMQDSNFGIRFRDAERPGVYFRVLNEGEIAAGDPVTLVENPGSTVSMLELFRAWYNLHPSSELLRRIVESPVGARARDRFRKKLEQLGA